MTVNISGLTPATIPLAGNEEMEVIQGGLNRRVGISGIGSAIRDQVGSGNTFSTRTAAQDNSPVAAPAYILTEGFSSAGDKGGALYKRVSAEPAHAGKFSITLQDGTVVWYELAEPIPSPFMFGAVEDGTDQAAVLQSFFDYITEFDVGTANVGGTFSVASGVVVGLPGGVQMATRHWVGDLILVPIAPIPVVMTIQGFSNQVHDGRIESRGPGDIDYNTQTCEVGVKLTGQGSRARFGGFLLSNFKFAGIHSATAGENTNMTTLGQCRISNCGSGNIDFGLAANWSNQVDAGSANSIAQTSTIDVDTILPEFVEDYGTLNDAPFMALINGEPYYITAVDRVASTITVHPWIDSTLGGIGTLTYLFGGGLYLQGSNTNVYGIDMLDCFRCSIGLAAASLYSPVVGRLVTQRNGMGWAIGRNRSSSSLGGSILAAYFEANTFDIAMVGQPGTSTSQTLLQDYELSWEKVTAVTTPRSAGNVRSVAFAALQNFSLNIRGVPYNFVKIGDNFTASSYSLTFDHGPQRLVFNRDDWTVNIQQTANSPHLNRLFGYDSAELVIIGSGVNGEPTGTITFNPPVGATVNGTTSAAFSSLTKPGNFVIYWDISSNDYIVVDINA